MPDDPERTFTHRRDPDHYITAHYAKDRATVCAAHCTCGAVWDRTTTSFADWGVHHPTYRDKWS